MGGRGAVSKVSNSRKKMDYKEYLKSDKWKKKRNQVKYWHGKKCHICLEKFKDIHHKTYKNLGKENQKVDLVPLCRKCHENVHKFCEENNFNIWTGTEIFISRNKKQRPLKWQYMTVYERSKYLKD